MPLTPITEFLNGGLNNTQHSALLNPGELQVSDDCVLRDSSIAIHRAPGRTVYNSTPLSAGTKGLAYLSFDQNTDQLIAWPQGDATNSYLYKSDFTTITGTFSVITGPGIVASCITNSTTIVTAPAGSFTNMLIGVLVTGSGIAAGTYIESVDSGTQITMTKAATASATVTLSFDAGIAYSLSDVGDEILDVIQWENTYFVLPKRGPISRTYWKSFSGVNATESLIIRPAGLLPVTQVPTITVQTGAGWSSILGNGFYWFLVTEILSPDGGTTTTAEAGYTANEGRAIVAEITANATQYIQVTFPTIRNNGSNGTNRATHWGIYMSVIGPGAAAYKDNTNMPSLATFRRVAVVPIDDTTKNIRFDNTTQGPNLPTTSAAVAGYGEFVNPSGLFTRGGTYMSTTTTLAKADAFAGFGFSAGSPYSGYTVTGIQVKVVAKAGSLVQIPSYTVWLDNNSTKVSNKTTGVAVGTTFLVRTFGNQFSNWGIAWVPTDIDDLRVIIQKDKSNSSLTLIIDYIEVTVYYSGAALSTGSVNLDGVPYQVVTYRSQIGTVVNDPANYIIPEATTGDIFQGSLVLNDTGSPSTIRYSLPNAPESFPKPYLMKFESKKKDIVNFIRKIGQILVVGMRDSIKRVNYLPTETDVDFQQGVAHEDIVTEHGIVGPLAGTLLDLPGVGVILAYVAFNGFYFTDGVTSRQLCQTIDIENLAKTSALNTSVLRVYPREKWLVFYYCPAGASHTKNTKALIFSYSDWHIKQGNILPAIGPLTISARAATEANISGISYLLTGHQTTGTVYVEDSGVIQAASYQVHNSSDSLVSAPIIPLIRTRKIYPAGYDRDAREQKVYVLYDALGTSYSISSTTVLSSTSITSSAAFANVVAGMLVKGTGIKPGTIVISKSDSSNIVISQAATSSGTVSLTYDDGTVATTIRGSGIREAVTAMQTYYTSTLVGDLFVQHHDNMRQGFELQIQKVVLPDASLVDLGVAMRLYNFSYLVEDGGSEMNRGTPG